ncbi:MAG: hypothetical protein P4L87_12905 [Formivibrio sp.]|nr:hypothetical protein [Formivibrio sp.]
MENEKSPSDSEMTGLNQNKQPEFFHHQQMKTGAIRAPHLNFYCSQSKSDADGNNHWLIPDDAYTKGGFWE